MVEHPVATRCPSQAPRHRRGLPALGAVLVLASTLAGAAPAWLPPDTPDAAIAAAPVERRGASLSLPEAPDLDIGDPRAVFAHVFASLPPAVTIVPTENYLYWRFHTKRAYVWGNLRLAAQDRDEGKIHIGYYEFREALKGPEDANPRHIALGRADAVDVVKVDPFHYRVRSGGRMVSFALNEVSQEPLPAAMLAESEEFVFRMVDESNVRFVLVYDHATRHFNFVLDETQEPRVQLVPVGDDLALELGSGFLFFVDGPRRERKTLVGVYRRNAEQNNYFDGPADQLADNYIPAVPKFRQFLHEAYPFTRGTVDQYGFYIGDEENRVAIGAYYPYDSLDEMRGMVRTCRQFGSVGETLACMAPDGRASETSFGAQPGLEPLAALPGAAEPPLAPLAGPTAGVADEGGATEGSAAAGGTTEGGSAPGGPTGVGAPLGGESGPERQGGLDAGEDIFFEDWERGLGEWTASGLWHVVGEPPTSCPPAPNFVSPTSSAYYGLDAGCTYSTGTSNFGLLTSTPIPELPSGAYLSFWYRRQTQGSCTTFDRSELQISADGGPFVKLRDLCDDSGEWIPSDHIDLGAFAGRTIRLQFYFDTVDALANNFLGLMVDDVRIAVGYAGPKPLHMAGTTWHQLNVTFVPPPPWHMTGITWHMAAASWPPLANPPMHKVPWSPAWPQPKRPHMAGVTWHLVNATFPPVGAKHAAYVTWHIRNVTFIPGDAKHAAGVTWHITGATFVPKSAKHQAYTTYHIAGATFIPGDAKHAAGITYHIAGQTFIPAGSKHAALVTWHVPNGTFVPSTAKHNAGGTWHIGGATFVPGDAKHAAGTTYHIAGQTFIPGDAKHAAGTTWHVAGGTFVPSTAKHQAYTTYHIANATFIPGDAKHQAGTTYHITGGTFIPGTAKHQAYTTYHIANATFIPGDAKHQSGTTYHITGGTFIPGTAKHQAYTTYHIAGATFIPGDAKHAAGTTYHVAGGTFIPGTAKHAAYITWHIAGATFVPGDAKHQAGTTYHIAGGTFIPGNAKHQAGTTYHIAGATFIPGDAKHAAGTTYHIPAQTFIPGGAKHMAGNTWHAANATFLLARVDSCTTDSDCPVLVCAVSRCSPVDGTCEYDPAPGASCDDGDPATHGDVCDPFRACSGQRPPGAPCDDLNPCTMNDRYQPTGACQGMPATGMPCELDTHCAGIGQCQPDGQCRAEGFAGMACEDDSECNAADQCDAAGGCYGTFDEHCDDLDLCNGSEKCDPLLGCSTAPPAPCNNVCAGANGLCDPQFGCQEQNAPTCDDGLACTRDECDGAGGCYHLPVDCDDGNACTVDGCLEGSGECRHDPLPDGVFCDDGNLCTTADTCTAGGCAGTPIDCGPCSTCDSRSGGCVPAAENTSCGDGVDDCCGGQELTGQCIPDKCVPVTPSEVQGLAVQKSPFDPGALQFFWQPAPGATSGYSLYEGLLDGQFNSLNCMEPRSTGLNAQRRAGPGNRYYLVVGVNDNAAGGGNPVEGPLGNASDGTPRSPAELTCQPLP